MSYIGRTGKLSQRAYNKVSFLATAGQTIKTGLSYVAGFVEVHVNGLLLTDTVDYTATNGNSVTFVLALNVDDEVTVISLKTFAAADMLPLSGGTVAGDLGVVGSVTVDGNLLVGTTNVDNSDQGIELRNDGRLFATATSDSSAFNRKTTDGDILQFAKEAVTVGSIGTYNGVPYIGYAGGAGGGIMFNGLSIEPTSLGATRTNGANDIGSTSYRWKDLHLSGGVVFDAAGGTGTSTSTTLDSYEEGTWTPFIDNGTLTIQGTTYTKVGRLVTVQAYLSNISIPNTTATFYIKGLPFAQTSTGGSYNAGQISYCSNGNLSGLGLLTHPGTSSLYMHYIDGTGHAGQLTNANYLARNTTGHIIFQMTYMSN